MTYEGSDINSCQYSGVSFVEEIVTAEDDDLKSEDRLDDLLYYSSRTTAWCARFQDIKHQGFGGYYSRTSKLGLYIYSYADYPSNIKITVNIGKSYCFGMNLHDVHPKSPFDASHYLFYSDNL